MAAQSKTTAVHFSLIFFVMLSVILGVVAYLFYSDYKTQEIVFLEKTKELGAVDTLNKRYQAELEAMKSTAGFNRPDVGDPAAPAEGTVLALSNQAIQAAMQTTGSNAPTASFNDALTNLRAELNNKITAMNQQQATIAELQATVEALRQQYETTSKEHDDRANTAEQSLTGEQAKYAESIATKDQDIAALREQAAALQTEVEQVRQQLNSQIASLQEDNATLLSVNTRLNKELDTIKGESFEVADGLIRKVNQVQRTVWINLGKADNLRVGTTFSVYEKNNIGIGRDNPDGGRPEDVKAAIEVTKLLNEPHLAEARILDDDSSRPISPGDPIYTPLWSTGRTEKFAFAGMIDIDDDGSFVGDRERLEQILAAHGAEISSQVTDEGERVPKNSEGEPVKIDEQTRFLVIGEMPAPLDVPEGEERERRRRIGTMRSEMETEARTAGVRVTNMNTFLDYIGFVPQQRRFTPGETPSWNLKSGTPAPATDTGTGRTSGLFDKSRSRPNPSGANPGR